MFVDAILGCVPGVPYRRFPDDPRRDVSHEQRDVPSLLAFLRAAEGLRILEIGCGRGVALPVLHARMQPTELCAIDIDPLLLAEAQKRVATRDVPARLVLGDVRSMPYADATFDLVLDFGTCYHITHADRALAEIARVLVPGGAFAYETRGAQLRSHPFRALLRTIPWSSSSAFDPERTDGEWGTRVRR
ncbi:MAG TPA: class I SAM-dependent methyltransferase [Kofleriaceae bacterium]|jgi:ubiquinone/menaquinone biosynthesis C-methylase UbiE